MHQIRLVLENKRVRLKTDASYINTYVYFVKPEELTLSVSPQDRNLDLLKSRVVDRGRSEGAERNKLKLDWSIRLTFAGHGILT